MSTSAAPAVSVERDGLIVTRRGRDGHVQRAECATLEDAMAFERILRAATPPAATSGTGARCSCMSCDTAEYSR